LKTPFATLRERFRWPAALAAGLLWAAAFPKIGLAGLAFLAPGLLLAVAWGTDGRRAFRLGYVAGAAHYLAALYWLLHIPVAKLAPVTGWLVLSAFLALFPATWVWLCWRCAPGARDPGAVNPATGASGLGPSLRAWSAVPWPQRALWALACAALWVAWEMIQARIFTGFPWNLLGASQYRQVPLIQVAAYTGVYGVSFFAVWFSVSLLGAGARLAGGSRDVQLWKSDLALPLLAGVGLLAWGVRAALRPGESGPPVRLALIQPSIPQRWIWDEQESARRFAQLVALSERALASRPEVLVWPEAAVPRMARWDPELNQAITNLARTHQVWMVIGSDDAEPATRPGMARDYEAFNAAFLVSPEGRFVGGYRKQRLVIFGEYIPLARWLPFLERWTGMGSFTPGDAPVPFDLPGLRCRVAPLICFEDIFPHGVREHVEDDTDFLVNLTNNGWFGESAAQWQHAASAVFRAVENGVPLVRCANNGLTCWVDAQGRMHEVFLPGTNDIYGAGFKLVEVPRRPPGGRVATPYRRHGDVFGWTCLAWAGLVVVRGWRRCGVAKA
jgi:apolipoprotein N-acyltransferase